MSIFGNFWSGGGDAAPAVGPMISTAPGVSPGAPAAIGVVQTRAQGAYAPRGGGVVTVTREWLLGTTQVATGASYTPVAANLGQALIYREMATETGGAKPGSVIRNVVLGPVTAQASVPGAFTAAQWSLANAGTGGALTLTITALPGNGGSAITALQVAVGAGAFVALGGTGVGVYTLSGLANGTAAAVKLRAVNAVGPGADSDVKSATPTAAATVPGAFTAAQWALADAGTGGALTLTITALPGNGGSAITALQARVGAGAYVPLGGAGTGVYSLGGLTNGALASVTIRAVNAVGQGPDSDVKSATPSAAVTVPGAFTAAQWALADAGTGGALRVTITALPGNGGSAITALQAAVGAGAYVALGGTGAGVYTITGLVNGTAAAVKLRAVNAIGSGPDSDVKSATPSAAATTVAAILSQSEPSFIIDPGSFFRQVPQPSLGAVQNVTTYTTPSGVGGAITKTTVNASAVSAGQVNPTVAAWSAFFNFVRPGHQFVIVDMADSGTSRYELVDDSNVTRSWNDLERMVTAVGADGLEVGHVIEDWYNKDASSIKSFRNSFMPMYTGQNRDGTAFTLGNTNPTAVNTTARFDHCLWDFQSASPSDLGRGVFRRSVTKLTVLGPMPFHDAPTIAPELRNFSTTDAGGTGPGRLNSLDRGARDEMIAFVGDSRIQAIGGRFGPSSHITHFEGDIHPSVTDPDGQILFGWPFAIALLNASGLTIGEPQVTGIAAASDGAFADVVVSLPNGGNLTTIRILEGRAAPATPAPHQQAVTGFEIRRNGDADNARRPVFKTTETSYPVAYRGTVTIQDTGSGSPRTGRIRITPEVPFANGDIVEFLRGAAAAHLLEPRDVDARIYLDMPLETIPSMRDTTALYPFPGVAVRPQPPAATVTISGVGVAPTVPGAFVAGNWTLTNPGTGGNLTVTVTALPGNGGSAITALQASVNGGAYAALGGSGTGVYSLSGLSNGVSASVRLRAVNAIGNGPDGDSKSATPSAAATAPAAFTAGNWTLTNPGTGGSLTVTVTVLPGNGGSAITALQASVNGGAYVALGGSGTGVYTLSGLTNGASASVRLRAVNAIGSGPDGDSKSATPSAAATVPGAFVAGNWSLGDAGTGGSLTVTVTALPGDGGSAITALQASVNGGAFVALSGTGTGARTLSGLTNGAAASVVIRAVNAVGNGPGSDTKTATPSAGVAVFAVPGALGTTGAAGSTPYFTPPTGGLAPANTTAVRFRARFRFPTGVAFPAAQQLLGSVGNSFVVQIINTRRLRCGVEDLAGATRVASQQFGPTGLAFDTTHDIDVLMDQTAGTVSGTVNGVAFTPLVMTGSASTFQAATPLFLAGTSTGGTPLSAGFQVEFLELYYTTSGVETLVKRIAGNAATVNADAWKRGSDAI